MNRTVPASQFSLYIPINSIKIIFYLIFFVKIKTSFSMTSSKDLTGKKFGLLTVTKNIDARHSGKYAIRNIVVKYFGFKEINTIALHKAFS